jgi:predicted neuraminidase
MYDMQVPLFLPAEARKVAQIALSHLDLFVTCNIPTPPNKPRLVAASKKEKSKRRKSWSERLRYNDLPNEAQVNLRVAVDADNAWAMALYQSCGATQLEQAA